MRDATSINRIKRFAFCIAIIFLFGCQEVSVRPVDTRLKIGDDITWTAPSFDDSGWTSRNGITGEQVFWLRFKIELNDSIINSKPLALQVIALGSFEAYWDGTFIGKNGRVGINRETETPGKHRSVFLLPDTLVAPGKHVIALRISNFHSNTSYSFYNAKIANYKHLIRDPLQRTAIICMLAGCFLVCALYYLFLFLNFRDQQLYLLFSIISLLFLCLLLVEYIPAFWDYSYTVQTSRLRIIGIQTFAVAFLVPFFLNLEFGVFPRKTFMAVYAAVLIGIYFYLFGRFDKTAQWLGIAMWIATLIIAGIAVLQKKENSLFVLTAILISGAISYFLYFDYSLYLSFAIVIVSMLYLLARRSKRMQYRYNEIQLLSERLKVQLLKKNIQPHFLMNTLTSLIDWVEESPKKGVEFIHALAGEFSILETMSDKQLVPIVQEIDLCKHHLKIMQFRKEIDYQWQQTGIDFNESIPPALIHTLLENGITHNEPVEGVIRFRLEFSKKEDIKSYSFHTIGNNRHSGKHATPGTGHKYIMARLTESYGNNWKMESSPSPEGWLVNIKLFGKNANPDHRR